jgi:hypothetical protein
MEGFAEVPDGPLSGAKAYDTFANAAKEKADYSHELARRKKELVDHRNRKGHVK